MNSMRMAEQSFTHVTDHIFAIIYFIPIILFTWYSAKMSYLKRLKSGGTSNKPY